MVLISAHSLQVFASRWHFLKLFVDGSYIKHLLHRFIFLLVLYVESSLEAPVWYPELPGSLKGLEVNGRKMFIAIVELLQPIVGFHLSFVALCSQSSMHTLV